MSAQFYMILNQGGQFLQEDGIFNNEYTTALQFESELDAETNGYPTIIYETLTEIRGFSVKPDPE